MNLSPVWTQFKIISLKITIFKWQTTGDPSAENIQDIGLHSQNNAIFDGFLYKKKCLKILKLENL